MNISPLERTTISEEILQKIADLILKGELESESKLPPERELSKMFGVARAPVREALRALALIGLVNIKPGRGTFIAKREEQISIASLPLLLSTLKENLVHVYHARRVVESELIVLASKHATSQEIETLVAKLEAMYQKTVELDGINYISAHDEFDEVVALASKNPILYQIYKALREASRESHMKILRLPDAMDNSNEKHEKIVDAIKSRNMELAKIAAKEHFDSVEKLLPQIKNDV